MNVECKCPKCGLEYDCEINVFEPPKFLFRKYCPTCSSFVSRLSSSLGLDCVCKSQHIVVRKID